MRRTPFLSITAALLVVSASLSAQERTEYELLVVEWAAAIRVEVVEAA